MTYMPQVMDFSQAERLGFIEAFKDFWTSHRSDNRSDAELQTAAEGLLRGCKEHFRRNVTRVSKISAVVGIGKAEHFKGRALALLSAVHSEDFKSRAALLLREYPLAEPWISWWLHDARVSMLFQSERKMEPEIWDAIPATTNAEESLHHVFYSGAGLLL